MRLSVLERLTLLASLPAEGNVLTLRTVKQLRETIALTDEEQDHWHIRPDPNNPGRIIWDLRTPEGQPIEQEIELLITRRGEDVVRQMLQDLNKKQKLTEAHLSLWDKFAGEE